ncbi:MAG: hypothetical protein M0R70_15765 [Nitrospirae bacterium]|nr:hypothetical protein [Nitrospirota bacterium]
MNSPLQAIESIAKSKDRARTIIFFLFFSRFEYALKRAGYVTNTEEAKADWQKYARKNIELLENNKEEPVNKAIALLTNLPPKKQILSKGQLGWSVDHFNGVFGLGRLFTLLCRIRNNLFHGGKFPEGPEEDISRDRDLIDAGITIMQACLDADEMLRQSFVEDLV